MRPAQKHLQAGTMTISSNVISITNAGFSPAAFTAANLAAADTAYIFTATNNLRVLATGDNPTATFGIPVTPTSGLEIAGNAAINNLKLIRESSDGVVTIILCVSN